MNRTVMLSGIVGAVVVAAGAGWFFGSQIRSPAEVAAEAEPPPASNITVEVVSETLSADVIARGDVVYDQPVQLTLSGSFADQPARLVVTETVAQGDELLEGDLAVEVVGRPVFLLTGEIPMYRDLRPGSSGDDVLQLEESLARLGFFSGAPDEVWDQDTGSALAAWYESAGYRANGLTDEDEAALSAARDRVRGAQTAVADAESALAQAGATNGSAIIAAEGEVDSAESALELARLQQDAANADAAKAVADAEAALAEAVDALDTAPPNDPTIGDLRDAVAEAETALETANRNVQTVALDHEAIVSEAETRLEVAQATLSEMRRGPDTSAMRGQVSASREELSTAREELAQLESELGTWLPAGELVFIDRLPVRVDQVSVARGSEITDTFLRVTGSVVTVSSAVSEADASLLEEGMEVEIENPEDDSIIIGVITAVADRPGTNGVAADRVHVEITPEEVPPEIVGQNVRIVIPVSSTGGDVLAVPAAALYSTADGSTRVEVEDEDGTLRQVNVETGLAAGGLVEVIPLDGGLAEGDRVVVGRADGTGPGGSDEDSDEDDA